MNQELPSQEVRAPAASFPAEAGPYRRYTGVWFRAAADQMDNIFICLPFRLIMALAMFALATIDGGTRALATMSDFSLIFAWALGGAALFGGFFFLIVWCLVRYGYTPGMYVLNLKLLSYPDFDPVTIKQVIKRILYGVFISVPLAAAACVYVISRKDLGGYPLAAMTLLGTIGLFVILKFLLALHRHPQKRGWHDIYAGTCMVHTQ